MSNKRAILLLICALSVPLPSSALAAEDMFSLMFRMMLTMMNVMSGVMLGNNSGWGNNWGNNIGGLNSFNLGMGAWPMMSGFGSPFNSFGSSPWSNGWGNPFGSSPWSNGWGNPFGGYPGGFTPLPGGYGYPGDRAAYGPAHWGRGSAPYASTALIEGRWFGNTGEVLEVRGNRFRLQAGNAGLDGAIGIENNIISMYSPQTNTISRYNFVRNQTGLLLQGLGGELLLFTRYPPYGAMF